MKRKRYSEQQGIMRTAVVLGTELPRSTAIIQSLGRRGVPIVALDHRLRMPGSYSRYITRRLIEEHEKNSESDKVGSSSKWHFSSTQAMETLISADVAGGLLLPTNDDYLMLVSKNHQKLAAKYVLTTSPWATLRRVMDKEQLYSMAVAADIDVPVFFSPADLEEAREIIAGLNFDAGSYIFKLHPWAPGPADLESGAMTRPAGGSAGEALHIFREIFDRTGQHAMIQEVVPGGASVCIGVTLLADKCQRVIAAYATQRVHLHTYSTGGDRIHPYELGANVFAKSIEDPEAIGIAGKLAEISGIEGVVTVEFRRSRFDQRLKLIKVDPRNANAAGLAATIGLDIPWLQYRYFCKLPVEHRFNYAPGKYWVWPDRWLRLFLRNRNRKLIKIRVLLQMAVRARSIAYFSVVDWRPFLRAMNLEILHWRKRNRGRSSLLEKTADPASPQAPAEHRSVDLILVCPHLGDGGVQRVVSVLANSLSAAGRRVCVVTLYDEDPVYELAPGVLFKHVPHHPLVGKLERIRKGFDRTCIAIKVVLCRLLGLTGQSGESRLWAFVKRLLDPILPFLYFPMHIRAWALRSIIRESKTGIVISFCGSANVTTIVATRWLDCRTIISERNDPARQRLSYPWDYLRRVHYNAAEVVTANTRGALKSMRSYVDADKMLYVPNPLFRPASLEPCSDTGISKDLTVLIVGRLHYQKAHDILLEAFARLNSEFNQWTLSIVGRGEEEQKLRRQSTALGIAGRVYWHGQVKDPFSFYRRADIFALPSRHEGAPNALLEAMSCGMAVIVSDASPGPLEIIDDGVNGIVVPAEDPIRLARAIERLAADPDLRTQLGQRAMGTSAEYGKKALKAWDRLIRKNLKNRPVLEPVSP